MSLTSPCFTASENTPDYEKLVKMPLDMKIAWAKTKIKEFYLKMNGRVYIAFSGGKDSTVLLHLVRSLYPDIPAVYIDTGLEFPEIREHVKTIQNVEWIKPDISFRKVIDKYGYPCIGKVCAHWINLAQHGAPSGLRQMQGTGKYGFKEYSFMIDAPFKVSEKCCDVMKKRPAHRYHRETGRCPYIGTRADESRIRREKYDEHGENDFNNEIPQSTPLSIWTDADIWAYIKREKLPYSTVYDMGYDRTGCVFCMFGVTQDRSRFIRLKATHPQLWAYCMRERERRARYEGSIRLYGDPDRVRTKEHLRLYRGY